MPKKGATATKIEKKSNPSFMYRVTIFTPYGLISKTVIADYIDWNMDNKTNGWDFFLNDQLVAHFTDVLYILMVKNEEEGLPDITDFSRVLEKLKRMGNPDDFPANWGKVNGMVF